MEITVKPKILQKLFELEGDNKTCADCGIYDVSWVSCKIGVFLCAECATVHRNLGTQISDAKCLNERWTDMDLSQIQGNKAAALHYERHVPSWYRKPDHLAPAILREHWIISKYLRMEFTETNPALDYSSMNLFKVVLKIKNMKPIGYDEDKNVTFVISKDNYRLSLYDDGRKTPKEVIHLIDLEVALAPKKMDYKNSMQLTYKKSTTLRHIYVMSHNPKHLINLYMAIRCYKSEYWKANLPPWSQHLLKSYMPCDFTMEGWLWKTGPRLKHKYRRRWFSLMKTKIMYHKDVMDVEPRGHFEICTTPGQICAELMESIIIGFNKEVYPFTIRTTQRTYCVAADNNIHRREWMRMLNTIVAVPLY